MPTIALVLFGVIAAVVLGVVFDTQHRRARQDELFAKRAAWCETQGWRKAGPYFCVDNDRRLYLAPNAEDLP